MSNQPLLANAVALPRGRWRAPRAAVTAVLLAGCTASVPAARLARHSRESDLGGFKGFLPGDRVALLAGSGCTVPDQAKRAASLGPWTVEESSVEIGTQSIELTLVDGSGQRLDVRGMNCVGVWPEELSRLGSILKGRRYLTPALPSCTRLAVNGPPQTLGGRALELTSVRVRDGRPWLFGTVDGEELSLDAATAQSCLGERPPSPVASTGCISVPDSKGTLRCRGTIPVWRGQVSARSWQVTKAFETVSETLVSIDGTAFGPAPATLRVRVANASSSETGPRAEVAERVVKAVEGRLGSLLVHGVQLVNERPDVALAIGAADVSLGEVEKTSRPMQSRYQDGTQIVPNPAKEKLKVTIQSLEDDVRMQTESYNDSVAQYETAIRNCPSLCNGGSAASRDVCLAGCKAEEIALKPKEGNLREARASLVRMKSDFASMPDTLEKPHFSHWSYDRIDLTRRATARLEIRTSGITGIETIARPVEAAQSDYEVAADPAHGVEGHRADLQRLANGDSELVAQLGDNAGGVAAAALRRMAMDEWLLRTMRPSGARAGGSQPQLVAQYAVRKRLGRLLGEGELADGGGRIGAAEHEWPHAGCGLMVLATNEEVAGEITELSVEGSLPGVDRRGLPWAHVELCAARPSKIVARTVGRARWSLWEVMPERE
jgi:hypothetical protein